MPLSVGATLQKIANGEVDHLTREEVFGLVNTRFLKEHNIPILFQNNLLVHISTAVRYRNSNHPHVKKLGLTGIMGSFDAGFKDLYSDMVDKAMHMLEETLKTHRVATAADDDDDEPQPFKINDIAKESYLAALNASLKQTKPAFRDLVESHTRQSYKAGRVAGINKLKSAGATYLPPVEDDEDDDYVNDSTDSDSLYYDQLLDDMDDSARDAMSKEAPDQNSFMSMIEAALFGQGYRTDLFTNNLFRVAQDGQQAVFSEHKAKDPAGDEWDYKWVAVIDNDTCEICIGLNSEPPKKLDQWEYNPGDVHYFCRCDWDPIPPNEDEEEEDDEEPNNEGTPGGEPGPGPEDEPVGDPSGNTPLYEDISDLDAGQREVAMHTMGHKEVEDYMKDTSLKTKLADVKNGKIVIGAYLNKFYGKPEEMVVSHFAARHALTIKGAYTDGRWWNKLRPSVFKDEMDMLLRVDTTLDAMKSEGVFKEAFEKDVASGRQLRLERIPGARYPDGSVIDNTAYYNGASNTVYFHDKTMFDLAGSEINRNKVIAHEFTHALANTMSRDSKTSAGWKELQRMLNKLNDKAVAEKIDGFVSGYSKTSWVNNQLGEEEMAEGVAAYIYSPKTFERNDLMGQKYQLLKEYLFNGVEFHGYEAKPLL